MSDPLTPTAGARFVLEREAAEARTARYRGRIVTPDATWDYTIDLAIGTEPVLSAGGAPPELEKVLAMIARLTARGADKRVEDGLPAWPHRITRWRGPGRGG